MNIDSLRAAETWSGILKSAPVFGFRAQFAVYSDVEGPYTAEEALCSHV